MRRIARIRCFALMLAGLLLSPALVRGRRLKQPDDLAGFPLIHDTTMERHAAFPTWATWLKAAGARPTRPRGTLSAEQVEYD